jgi:hypothetical protein
MTNLQELIETAQKLSHRLEQAASEEKRFCVDICMKLEALSWEIYRTANELNEIKEYIA